MKARVVIEDSKSLIQLTPETPFEETLLEAADNSDFTTSAHIDSQYSYGLTKRSIEIRINKKKG